jgi:hypothetical protein
MAHNITCFHLFNIHKNDTINEIKPNLPLPDGFYFSGSIPAKGTTIAYTS